MYIWELLVILGLAFLILEMFNPVMFFLNFAISALIVALISVVIVNINILMLIFVVLSLMFLFILRPILMKNLSAKNLQTGIISKYINNKAKVIEKVTADKGSISIYDERWEARTLNGEEIQKDKFVNIVANEGLIMFVESED